MYLYYTTLYVCCKGTLVIFKNSILEKTSFYKYSYLLFPSEIPISLLPSLFHAISILPGKLLSPGSSVLYSLFRFLSAVSIHHPAYFFRLSGAEKTVWKLSCWRRRNTNTGIRRLKKGMHPHWADRGNAQHEAIRRYYIRRLSPLTL